VKEGLEIVRDYLNKFLFRYNGVEFLRLSQNGLVEIPGLLLSEIVNVSKFGVRGDDKTDNTEILQKIFDNAEGKIVFFPPGTYLVSNPINVLSNTVILGSGWKSVIKLRNGANCDIFYLNDVSNIIFRDLTIEGNKANNPGVGAGIKCVDSHRVYVDHCKIVNAKYGIVFDKTSGSKWDGNNIISHCWIQYNKRYGVKLPTDSDLFGCFIGENGVDDYNQWNACGVFVDGWDCRIVNNHIWGSKKGIQGNWCQDVHVIANVIEENYQEGITVYGYSSGWQIIANYIEDNSKENYGWYAGVKIADMGVGDWGYNINISLNRFGKEANQQAGHSYCVYLGERVDDVIIAHNNIKWGYVVAPFYYVEQHIYIAQPDLYLPIRYRGLFSNLSEVQNPRVNDLVIIDDGSQNQVYLYTEGFNSNGWVLLGSRPS